MRIVVSEFMSLDGVVQAPGGPDEDRDGGFAHGGWSMRFFDPESMGEFIDDGMAGTDALLFGRRTWQTMAAAWPQRDGDPFADRMNEIRKYVVSSTLSQTDLGWNNSHLIEGDDVVAAVTNLAAQPGRDLHVMGSAELVRTLVGADLVDEYRLLIEPIVLGGGKRIFPADGVARDLRLASASTSPTGVLICSYARA